MEGKPPTLVIERIVLDTEMAAPVSRPSVIVGYVDEMATALLLELVDKRLDACPYRVRVVVEPFPALKRPAAKRPARKGKKQ